MFSKSRDGLMVLFLHSASIKSRFCECDVLDGPGLTSRISGRQRDSWELEWSLHWRALFEDSRDMSV